MVLGDLCERVIRPPMWSWPTGYRGYREMVLMYGYLTLLPSNFSSYLYSVCDTCFRHRHTSEIFISSPNSCCHVQCTSIYTTMCWRIPLLVRSYADNQPGACVRMLSFVWYRSYGYKSHYWQWGMVGHRKDSNGHFHTLYYKDTLLSTVERDLSVHA